MLTCERGGGIRTCATVRCRFYLQGDPEYDTPEKKREREKLKKHARLQKAIRQVRSYQGAVAC